MSLLSQSIIQTTDKTTIIIECFDCTESFKLKTSRTGQFNNDAITYLLIPEGWTVKQDKEKVKFNCPHCSKIHHASTRT